MQQAFRMSLVMVLFFLLSAGPVRPVAQAQQPQTSARLNPQIEKIVSEISAANIEANIRKLVSFGTRHTMSEQDNPTRGIGAARRWIKEEFEKYSREAGGRLQVTEDEFMQPAGGRITKETKLVNVVATLPGVQAESKDRLLVVSGHYDSCVCSQSMTEDRKSVV